MRKVLPLIVIPIAAFLVAFAFGKTTAGLVAGLVVGVPLAVWAVFEIMPRDRGVSGAA